MRVFLGLSGFLAFSDIRENRETSSYKTEKTQENRASGNSRNLENTEPLETRKSSASSNSKSLQLRLIFSVQLLNSICFDSFETMPICSEIAVFVSAYVRETSSDCASRTVPIRYGSLTFASHGHPKYLQTQVTKITFFLHRMAIPNTFKNH